MTKSIEGAIAEVSDMLQRMRELSIQAANGTNSASDRTYLQDEVNLLIQEITRVSANTRYNGSLILDGTFINKQLQVGIEEGEHITFSVDSVAANQIGAHTLIGNGVNPETPGATAPVNPVTTAEDIEIFGYLGTKLIEASTEDTAKETAQKVNLATSDTGVRAYAKTYAALSSGDATARTYNIKINNYQTGNFVISSTDVSDAVEAINRISGASGVTAKAENNKVVLFDADGDDIRIENTKAGAEFVDLVVEKLGEDGSVSNVVGQPIRFGTKRDIHKYPRYVHASDRHTYQVRQSRSTPYRMARQRLNLPLTQTRLTQSFKRALERRRATTASNMTLESLVPRSRLPRASLALSKRLRSRFLQRIRMLMMRAR